MRTLRFLLRKEFLQIARDRTMLGMLIAAPVIQLLLLSSATTFEVRSTKMYLVDHDRSSTSRGLVERMVASGRFDATADFGRLGECDVVISCVPTPLGKHLEPDLSFVRQSAVDVARTLRKGQLIVLESSTYPGTTREVMLPLLEGTGLTLGEDFYLAYSPEREDPGRKDHNTQTIPKLVGGCDSGSGELAAALYKKAIKRVILVRSAEVAEAAKILENCYRCINIAFINELKIIFDRMGIDVWKVIHLQADMNKMVERLRRRALKENRFDDANDAVVRKRLDVYERDTKPMLDYYPDEKIVPIDAMQPQIRVLTQILNEVAPLKEQIDKQAAEMTAQQVTVQTAPPKVVAVPGAAV